MEFDEIIRGAGDWASDITLREPRWSKATKTLTLDLYSDLPVGDTQQEELRARILEQFPFCESISLNINGPEFEEVELPQIGVPVTPVKKRRTGGKTFYGTRPSSSKAIKINELLQNRKDEKVIIGGELLSFKCNPLPKKPERSLLLLTVTDGTNTICAKAFPSTKTAEKVTAMLHNAVKDKCHVRLYGKSEYDNFSKETVFSFTHGEMFKKIRRADISDEKRVELHLHTKMSVMDGLTDVTAAIETAARFGHKALAITDHGVAQAFPEAYKAGAKHGVKILYGVEGYLQHDSDPISMNCDYVVVDIETTGLKPETEHIIEIGAVRITDGKISDRYNTFIDACVPLTDATVKLTGITNEMIKGAPHTEDALKALCGFAEGAVLVAHNASFDVGFLSLHCGRYGIPFNFRYVDTLMLSRYLLFGMKNNKLDTVCERLGVRLLAHHRAVDDAEATAEIFLKMLDLIRDQEVDTIPANIETNEKRKKYNHIVLIARTQDGIKNLYRLVSLAHINFFHHKPLIPKYLLTLFRKGILLGAACEQGEVFQALLHGMTENDLLLLADWYDYLEIQPLSNNKFMVRENIVRDDEALRELNRRIVALGKQLDKPVVATGDVHFLEPEDSIFRAILMNEMGYADADLQAELYYKTTDEMLEEFSYLGEECAREVVINAPNAVADICEAIKPYPDGTFAPQIEKAEQTLKHTAISRAKALYGEPLPEPVKKRLDKELKSIIDNGFASLYLTAKKLVDKSLEDGYLVGSRGSVGSSLVATMAGITEVNPLPPHYMCKCGYSDFSVDKSQYACGTDMPERLCPECGITLHKEGFDIPFEVFLGFKGDKTPDIDLNFSGEYQPAAHKYTEEMFGENHAFRAGTISGIKDKTAYAFVMKYLEKRNIQANRAEVDRLCSGCLGVKRTTGQHPGGIVVLPKDRDILEFTPIQYPADDRKKQTITTHFDFHALDDRLVKLDILGHDDPTVLRMLHDMTGVDPRGIPLNDPETLLLYSSAKGLNINLSALSDCDVGSLGLPEFGTPFVRQMLMDTRPTTFEELVRIAGLSHGTDVWLNNAQEIVSANVATLREVICTRDDIMNSLIARGCDPSASFKIMENVRKGKGVTTEMENAMRECATPEWFINSCKKIKYMFPRAHAVAYVLMSFRVAYYKQHYPEAFYAAYFTVRADAFNILSAKGGADAVLGNLRDILKKGKEATNQENELVTILEVVYEMNLRGISLLDVDIYASDAVKFTVETGGIRPPFNAVAGVGDTAAISIAERVKDETFFSIEDFQIKTKANSSVIAALKEAGCFSGMAEMNQISMF